MVYIFLWWLIIEIFGLAATPVAYRIFRWLPDRGYAFTKSLGLLLVSYILWIGGITGLLKNNFGGILFATFLVIGFAFWLVYSGVKRKETTGSAGLLHSIMEHIHQNKRQIIVVEVLFAFAFIAWAGLRAFAPDKIMSAGGEKFMEMAFLNGVLKSPIFPPIDVWLSGFGISYYYFGYLMMGLLTRLSGAPAGVGFELYDALLFALAIIGAYGVVYNLVAAALKQEWLHNKFFKRNNSGEALENNPLMEIEPARANQPISYGLLGALLVIVMGNLEGLLESLYSLQLLSPRFWSWIDIPGLLGTPASGGLFPGGGFFGCCWRASRVIQDYDLLRNPVGVSPITEFPIFSFLLGDNHPHVLALPFVLLSIALAFNLLLRQASGSRSLNTQSTDPEPGDDNQTAQADWWNPISSLENGTVANSGSHWFFFIVYALCLGSLGFLNTWDMPIYLGLTVLAYALGEYWREKTFSRRIVRRTITLAVGLFISAILFYLLFYLGFSSQAGGVLPYLNPPTRLPQFIVIFGVFLFLITWFLLAHLKYQLWNNHEKRRILRAWLKAWLAAMLICIGITACFLLLLFLFEPIRQLTGLGNSLPSVTALLAGLSPSQALSKIIQERFYNPWLLLTLTSLLGLAIINIRQPSAEANLSTSQTIPDRPNQPILTGSMFAMLMIFIGLALVLSVEIFFLADSFGARMNTVFKFYYQAWILLGLASAYGIWWVLNAKIVKISPFWRISFILITALLVGAGLIYTVGGSYQRVGGFQSAPNLDGTSGLAKANPDDWAAITWLNQNVQSPQTILEAPGKSYNYEGRISAFSGFPTLLGWALHEGQWRGNYDEQGRREPDIQSIYTTRDASIALDLLRKWDIRYVILGTTEKNYIMQLCSEPQRACNLSRALQKFDTILIPVFEQGDMTIYRVPDSGE